MKSILDPGFKYTPSVSTDIRKTFARIRRMEREATKPAAEPSKVVRIDVPRKIVAAAPRKN